MAITDPRAIKFSNEVLRPMCEKLRDLLEDCSRFDQAWTDEIGALMTNDPLEALDDGREAEGISRLNGQEVNRIKGVFKALIDFRDGSAVAAVANVPTRIGKACVRTLRQ